MENLNRMTVDIRKMMQTRILSNIAELKYAMNKDMALRKGITIESSIS